MPQHVIKLLKDTTDNPVTIDLRLDSNGKLIKPESTDVYPNDNVIWQPDANIVKFKVRGKFLAHHHPFKFRPYRHLNPTLSLPVRPENKHDYVWKYTIIYTTTSSSHRHRLDPKIAVKSVRKSSFDFTLMLTIFIFAAGKYFYRNLINCRVTEIIRKRNN
jgi:hypothetical protein